MKFFLIFISLLAIIAFTACHKVGGPANGNSIQPNNHLDSTVSVSGSLNGVKWQTDSAFGYFVKNSGNDSGEINLLINATQSSSNSSLTIYITNFTGANTYPVNPPWVSITYYKGSLRFFATTGSINITSDTLPSLLGTFNFTADTLIVSNGLINVALP